MKKIFSMILFFLFINIEGHGQADSIVYNLINEVLKNEVPQKDKNFFFLNCLGTGYIGQIDTNYLKSNCIILDKSDWQFLYKFVPYFPFSGPFIWDGSKIQNSKRIGCPQDFGANKEKLINIYYSIGYPTLNDSYDKALLYFRYPINDSIQANTTLYYKKVDAKWTKITQTRITKLEITQNLP